MVLLFKVRRSGNEHTQNQVFLLCRNTVHLPLEINEIKKEHPLVGVLSLFGGAEGSRTPVRKSLDTAFSECSLIV